MGLFDRLRPFAVDFSKPRPAVDTSDPIHVRIRELSKRYGDHQVLKSVSFDILRGKTNLIIGPSGSGKTVMMRQLIRLEEPDAGEILVNGRDIARLKGLELDAMRASFGMVFQQSALFDSMTVFENVAFPLVEHTRLSRAEVRDRVAEALRRDRGEAVPEVSLAELRPGTEDGEARRGQFDGSLVPIESDERRFLVLFEQRVRMAAHPDGGVENAPRGLRGKREDLAQEDGDMHIRSRTPRAASRHRP